MSDSAAAKQAQRPLLIVALGASAGGLDAFREFFQYLPADSGMAFVLIQHRSTDHSSMLRELVGRYTAMPVVPARAGDALRPDHVYIAPAQQYLGLHKGRFQVYESAEAPGQRTPINAFFRALAADQGPRTAGVVLSGMGTEGTLGARAIKEAGGLVLVQDAESAQYDSMPCSAAAAHVADSVLPPHEMAGRLVAFAQQDWPSPGGAASHAEPGVDQEEHVDALCRLLRDYTGHDFSQYKPGTLYRRIERQRLVNQCGSLEEYVEFARYHTAELGRLFRELLVPVTSFFRDPEAFEAVRNLALQPLVARHAAGEPLRFWVPGCATGEEAYSLAILAAEEMERQTKQLPLEIFASDIDAQAVQAARHGIYPAGLEADVSQERLVRFFVRQDHMYQVSQEIRDHVVFAEQSVFRDPPFSHLDLISCRNVLIYLNGDLQKRVLTLFHYALRPGGYLLLGGSETVGENRSLFEPVDSKSKLFQRKTSEQTPPAAWQYLPARPQYGADAAHSRIQEYTLDYGRLTEKSLLEYTGIVGVLVDAQDRVLYIHGRSGRYLEPPAGAASLEITSMAREGLRPALAAALQRARAEGREVQRRHVCVRANGTEVTCDVTARPVHGSPGKPHLMLVILEPAAEAAGDTRASAVGDTGPETATAQQATDQRIVELEQELQASREHLQSTVEELLTSNEEYCSANEELSTVNAELQSRVQDTEQMRNDMQNLLDSLDVATVFLDLELRIQRFTPSARRLANLIDGDVGRPLNDLVWHLEYERLADDARQVLDTLIPLEREVRAADGNWYLVRMRPYRTAGKVIEGVVVLFIAIGAQKEAQDELETLREKARAAQDMAEGIVATVPDPLVVLDADLVVVSASSAFCATFGHDMDEVTGQRIYELGQGAWDNRELRRLLDDVLPGQSLFEGFEMTHRVPGGNERRLRLSGREVRPLPPGRKAIMLVIQVLEEDN